VPNCGSRREILLRLYRKMNLGHSPTVPHPAIGKGSEASVTDSLGRSCGGLFTGTAWHYARYRPGYPQVFLDDLVQRFHLDGTASRQANAAGVVNAIWVHGNSADLPGEFGRFRLVTMDRSFHWMDREQVLTAFDRVVEEDGGLVIANDSCLVRPTTIWQRAIEDVQRRFLPTDQQPGKMTGSAADQPHEEILARSPFAHVHRLVYEFDRPWTLEQAVGYLYSTSLPLRQLLGDQRTDFAKAITSALLAIDPNGQFAEPVTLVVFAATRG
jgi:hypothetical protein